MGLTPTDIHHKEFKGARFGGYNEDDVDAFLDLVADELENLLNEKQGLENALMESRSKLKEFEDMQSSLHSALLAATKSAEEIKSQGNLEAREILARAKEDAQALINSAKEHQQQIAINAENDSRAMENQFARLRELKQKYILSIKETATSQLEQIEILERQEDPNMAKVEVAAVIEKKPVSKPSAAPASPPVPVTVSPLEPQGPVLDEEPESQPAENLSSIDVVESRPASNKPAVGKSIEKSQVKAVSQKTDLRVEDGNKEKPREIQRPIVAEIPSEELVDEVLAMNMDDDVYDVEDSDEEQGGSRRSRRFKKEKRASNAFWE